MLALGVDIGGTNGRAAVIDSESGKLVHAAKESWSNRDPDAVVEAVAQLIKGVAKQAGSISAAAPVGAGFAGMLNGSVVVNAPNLGWREVDFGTLLSKRVGRRVRLFNDLAAAAWGEFSAGCARDVDDSFTVFAGTGVGSAIIANGALLRGATGVAGEFGHIKVVFEGGRKCGCGQWGCLEAYMGGANLEEWMRENGISGKAAQLERLAQRGDATARQIYDFAVDALGLAIANQVTVLNTAMVVLGGGVLSHCPGMVERVTSIVQHRANAPAAKAVRIELAQLGDDAGLVGAALLGAQS